MKNLRKNTTLAAHGLVTSLLSCLATVPLAPFMILTLLYFMDRSQFNQLADFDCIALGWIIAGGVGLLMSLVIHFPLSLFMRKLIIGPQHRIALITMMASAQLITATYFLIISFQGAPIFEDPFLIATLITGIHCQIIGTTLFFAEFRRRALKVEAQFAEKYEPKRPPIPALTEGRVRNCRIGTRHEAPGYTYAPQSN